MDIQYDEPQGGGLYIIWLSETHYYGGRTTSFKRRWREHLQAFLAGTHNARAQNVFNKHEVFKPEILQLLDQDAHVEAEQEWLDENYRKEGCVNLSPHATGGCESRTEDSLAKQVDTWHQNPENLEKARASLAENTKKITSAHIAVRAKKSSETRRGSTQSSETIEKRRQAHLGRKNTPETRALMSESAKRRCEEKPQRHSVGTKKKISRQQRGRIWINDGERNKRMFLEDAQVLLDQGGWVRGKLGKSGSGLWAHRLSPSGELLERRRVPAEELGGLLSEGWLRGTGPQGTSPAPR